MDMMTEIYNKLIILIVSGLLLFLSTTVLVMLFK